MNPMQQIKLSMYHSIIEHFDANAVSLNSISNSQKILLAFKAKTRSITSATLLESEAITRIQMNRGQLRDHICQQAAAIDAVVSHYATKTANEQLRQKINYPLTVLEQLRDDQMIRACRAIHSISETNLIPLVKYGINPGMLNVLNTMIDSYVYTLPVPPNTFSLRVTYAASLRILFKETDEWLVTQLDKMVMLMTTRYPVFCSIYKAHRMAIEEVIPVSVINGTVTHGPGGKAIQGARIEVQGTPLKTISDTSGFYELKLTKSGLYYIKVSKEGYVDNKICDIIVRLDKKIRLDIPLKK